MISKLHQRIVNYVETTNVFMLTFLICLFTLSFSMPPYDSSFVDTTWDAIFNQIKHPFSPIESTAWSHNSKLTFRLFPVFVGKFLYLNKFGFLFSLFLVGFLIIQLAFSFFLRLLKDKYKSFLLTLSFSFIYAGKCSFLEFRGIFDGYAVILLLLSLFSNNSIVIYFSILFAAFTDERALIASGFIFLYYLVVETVQKFNENILVIFFSWGTYFLFRYLLLIFFGLKTSTGGISFEIMASNFELFPFTIFSLYEGFWVLIFLFYYRIYKLNKLHFSFFLIMLLIILFPSYLVFDVSRSLVFGSVLIFIVVAYFSKYQPTLFSINFCLLILAICFMYPCYVVGGSHITWIKPFFLEFLFRFFTNS